MKGNKIIEYVFAVATARLLNKCYKLQLYEIKKSFIH